MFDFSKLIDPQYLFTINRVMMTRSDRLFFVVGCAFVAVAVVLKIASTYAPSPVDRGVRNKFFKLFLTVGLLEAVWFGARYANVRFFGSHFVALLILLVGLVWFVWLAASLVKHYKRDKAAWEKEQVKLKYLR